MKNLQILLILVFSILVGCKVLPEKGYRLISDQPNGILIDELSVDPVRKLEFSKFQMNSLTFDHPKLSYKSETTDSIITSLFESISIDIKNTGSYELIIESLCDCLGFTKLIFDPIIEIRNTDNLSIPSELIFASVQDPAFSLPARLNKTWRFKLDEPSEISIIVFSQNERLNEPLDSRSSWGYYGTVTYTTSVFLTTMKGKFRIKIEKINTLPNNGEHP